MKNITVISAIWCPSCLILKKQLKKLKQEYPDLAIETLDYDFDEEEVQKYHIGKTLPVIIHEEKQLIGEKSYEEIVQFLKDCGVV